MSLKRDRLKPEFVVLEFCKENELNFKEHLWFSFGSVLNWPLTNTRQGVGNYKRPE